MKENYTEEFKREVVRLVLTSEKTQRQIAKDLGVSEWSISTWKPDRGVQYCSNIFRDALRELGMISSMLRKGNCRDKAPAESFFATLKYELIHHSKLKNAA